MDNAHVTRLGRELDAFLDGMVEGMGRPERRAAMRSYMTGLLLDGERKSIEPLAARLVDDAKETDAMRQRLQQCVSASGWSDDELRRRLALKVDRELRGVETLVIDDTGFPKKGEHSVGVARQYSGTLGRTDNCQVATSLHLASEQGSACIALTLYLPETWASDRKRRRQAGVPTGIKFRKKWEIALDQVDAARRWGVSDYVLLADAGYGDATEFREGLIDRRMRYVVGVQGNHHVWPPGTNLQEPAPTGKQGRPRTRWIVGDGERHVSIAELAGTLKYRAISWRDGSRGRQTSRFAAVRLRTAERHTKQRPPSEIQWLFCEWPSDEKAPMKFWLSNLSAEVPIRELVRLAKLRWRVERDYQELKQEIGLDHFEGRSWRGFHHHATLCSVAHAFLVLRRALFPPEAKALDPAHGAARTAARATA